MEKLWIYFLSVGTNMIKIGKSQQERHARLLQHQAPALDGRTVPTKLLCEVRAASDTDETTVHRYFDHHKMAWSREVFEAGDDLIGYVRWLRDEYYVAVEETSDEAWEALPMVESDQWLPRRERIKARDMDLLPGMYPPFDLGPRLITIDDYYTNQLIIEAAREAMGGIDLDPATHAVANTVVKATKFFTASTNGLAQEWGGRVWLNPPFSKWRQWAAKINLEIAAGRVSQLCTLASTGAITAEYFHSLISNCDAICIFRGRIPFWGGKTTSTNADSPTQGHVVLYFGENRASFRRAFEPLGTVFDTKEAA